MYDPSKVIFIFSKYEMSECEERRNLGILSNEDPDFVKTRTKEAAKYSYRNYINNVP